jgi:hypothetical protein
MAEYIQVAGKSDLYVGFPSNSYATLLKIGEQMDDTQLDVEQIFHDVPGDRHGGPQGRPIERQILGMTVRGQFNLSRWDPEVRRLIIQHNAMSKEGSISDSEIGALVLRDRSFRICIVPSRDNIIGAGLQDAGKDYFFYNFPCCCVTGAIATGQGTKFSTLRFAFEAFRVPTGHPLAPTNPAEGLIWNRDTALVPKYSS